MHFAGTACGTGLGPAPVFVAAGTGARETPGAGGVLEIPYPAGIAAGQQLIAVVYMQDATAVNIASVPSGWTQIGSTLSNAGATVRAYCISKVADGTETGSLSVSLTDANVDVFSAGRMFSFGPSSVRASASIMTDASATSAQLPAVTPTLNNSLLVGIVAGNGSATFSVGSQAYAEAVAEYNPGANVTIGVETKALPVAASSFDDGAFSAALTHRARFHFALK